MKMIKGIENIEIPVNDTAPVNKQEYSDCGQPPIYKHIDATYSCQRLAEEFTNPSQFACAQII